MLISILIPTFNRCEDLIKNLEILESEIKGQSLEEEVYIIVSDNNSTDNTSNYLRNFRPEFQFEYYVQSVNIGIERNTLFLLNKSIAKFVMFLGDDDFISQGYISRCLGIIKSDKEVSCIIPVKQSLYPDGSKSKIYSNPIEEQKFTKGFNSVKSNIRRAHQMSGVLNLRLGLYSEYERRNYRNVYPFVFFVFYNLLRGNLYVLQKFPVLVSAKPLNDKEWNYGECGLFDEIVSNYKGIDGISEWRRFILEYKLFRNEIWRVRNIINNEGIYKALLKLRLCVHSSGNFSVLTQLFFPIIMFRLLMVMERKLTL